MIIKDYYLGRRRFLLQKLTLDYWPESVL